MTNYEFYKEREMGIIDIFHKALEHGLNLPDDQEGLLRFLLDRASTALIYDIGEIIKYGDRYYKIERFYKDCCGVLDSFWVEGIDKRFEVSELCPESYRTHIPQELLDLAKREILATLKCPLATNETK